LEQSEKTIKFNRLVKSLVDSGTVKNYTQIIDELDWNKSMMSSVTNGVKNVPNDVYRKFLKVYQLSDEEINKIEAFADDERRSAALRNVAAISIPSWCD